jgi:hypothetical protein
LFLDVAVFSFTHCLMAHGVDEIRRRLHQNTYQFKRITS